MQLTLRWTRGRQGFPPFPAFLAQAFARPVCRGARIWIWCSSGLGGGRDTKKPSRRAALPLSGWETSKAHPFPPKPNTATALKAEADGFCSTLCPYRAQAVAPLHLQMILVTLYWSPLMHGTNYLFGEAILIKLLSTEFKSLKQEKQKAKRLKCTHTPQT